MDVYELVFQKSSSYTGDTATKVKQEILHGLGNLIVFPMKPLLFCILFFDFMEHFQWIEMAET